MKDLKLEIHAQNEIKRLMILIINNLIPQLPQYIGKKITVADGFSKKFNVEFFKPFINAFENGHAQIIGIRLEYHFNKLELKLKLCFNGGSYDTRPSTAYTKYIDKTVSIATLTNNEILEKIGDITEIISSNGLDTVIDIDVELKAIKEYKELFEQLTIAKKKINIDADFYKYL
jgi:hypothetical protein